MKIESLGCSLQEQIKKTQILCIVVDCIWNFVPAHNLDRAFFFLLLLVVHSNFHSSLRFWILTRVVVYGFVPTLHAHGEKGRREWKGIGCSRLWQPKQHASVRTFVTLAKFLIFSHFYWENFTFILLHIPIESLAPRVSVIAYGFEVTHLGHKPTAPSFDACVVWPIYASCPSQHSLVPSLFPSLYPQSILPSPISSLDF